jgi:pyruvate/2-oxoglutarate dehydrogenase complex dihydrolipoamide dehydrogenase (E3) component
MTEIPFDTLVLSTGSIVKKPAEFNASFSNVFTLKSVTDYTRWNQYCSENTIRDVLVIGAGVLGMELADTLAIANYQVTLIDSEQSPIASGGMSMSKLLLALLEKREIAFYSSAGRLQVNGTGGRVNTVKVDGRIISTDAVFLCSGFAPNTLLASTAGLELGACGGLKVDTHLATAGGTIYACGDMIEFAELVSGKPKLHNSAVFAHESGHIAGANAAGNKQTCNPFLRNTTARFFECFYAQVGLSRRECETHFPRYAAVEESTLNKSRFLPSSRSTYCTIYVEPLNGMILGGEILGGDETNGLANLLALCITRKVPISELERVSFSYTPTTSPLVHPFALLGRKGTKLLTTRKRYV